MSFFQEESDDSNLQYDNAAFLYFIASALIVGAAATLVSLLRDLLSLAIPHKKTMLATGYLDKQVENLAKWKRRKVFNRGFFLKLAVFLVLALLTLMVYQESRLVENKMKGFDPFEILGLSPGATLREVKKAYRKLALEYHPDRNQGDPEAQAKFILISKSYECFTDESKTANCFKYGNPDGVGSFRVGIGLPKFFIETEYKWYVLPVVLAIFLVVVPCFLLSWSNRSRGIDPNGISVRGYRTLFQCMEVPPSKYISIAFLSSYVEAFEHPLNHPITPQDRQLLEAELVKNPDARRPVLSHFNDRQLQAFWNIYKFCEGIGDFSHPELREEFERLLAISFQALKPFATKVNDGVVLFGNPDWTIRYMGVDIMYAICRFSRDYYNRCLTSPERNLWLHHLSLTADDRALAQQVALDPIVTILQSKEKIERFVGLFAEAKRERLRKEMAGLPIYQCQVKAEVDGKQVEAVTPFDYISIKFRIARQPGSGFCVLSNYPFPKPETVFLMITAEDNLVSFQKIEFRSDKHEHIGRVPFRAGKPGMFPIHLHFISSTYYCLDAEDTLILRVVPATAEQENKKIQFHPEDINIEKSHKNFFEQLMDMEMDTEATELSDSEGEEEEQTNN